jgi:hypothetical protein
MKREKPTLKKTENETENKTEWFNNSNCHTQVQGPSTATCMVLMTYHHIPTKAISFIITFTLPDCHVLIQTTNINIYSNANICCMPIPLEASDIFITTFTGLSIMSQCQEVPCKMYSKTGNLLSDG